MSAETGSDRTRASGLWRASVKAQRREVIVSLGETSLTILDPQDRVLAHWALGALARASRVPAVYYPDGDPDQTLELPASEASAIARIDRVIQLTDRRRPHPGKLRLYLSLGLAVAMSLLALIWLPGALERTATRVVPDVTRLDIGTRLLDRVALVAGTPCALPQAEAPMRRFTERLLGPGRGDAIHVLPSGIAASGHLPGGLILLNRTVFEDFETPEIAAGHVLAEVALARESDPLADLLDFAGLAATLRLLTTGRLPQDRLDAYALYLLGADRIRPQTGPLLAAFEEAGVRSTPFAHALDITGETVLSLIEGDPFATSGARPVVSDSDWVRLQGICGG